MEGFGDRPESCARGDKAAGKSGDREIELDYPSDFGDIAVRKELRTCRADAVPPDPAGADGGSDSAVRASEAGPGPVGCRPDRSCVFEGADGLSTPQRAPVVVPRTGGKRLSRAMASLLGIAALLAAASVQAQESTCNDPDLSDRRAVWSATLTVGEVTGTGDETHRGFYKQGASRHGTLNPSTFDLYPRGIWSVDRILEDGNGRLSFRARPTEFDQLILLPFHGEVLVLHVCDREFAFRGKSRDAVHGWRWSNANLGLAEDETRTLTLSFPANNPATGEVTIDGKAEVGHTLVANTSTVDDPDGRERRRSHGYQWSYVDTNGTEHVIPQPRGSGRRLTLRDSDLENRFKVRFAFRDNFGASEELTSAPTGVVVLDTKTPRWTADVVGNRLTMKFDEDLEATAIPGTDAFTVFARDGLAPERQVHVLGMSLHNRRDLRLELGPMVMHGEDASFSYTKPADAAERLRDPVGNEVDGWRGRFVRNNTPENSPATGTLAIRGTAEVGRTLTALTGDIADQNGLGGVSYSYQWIRVGNGTETDISGEARRTYTVAADDVGKHIKVKTRFNDSVGYAETRSSAPTALVPDTVPPELEAGGARVDGATLTLLYNEPLDTASEPAASAFVVTAAGSAASVSSVSVSGATVTLILAAPVGRNENVTLSYTTPSGNAIRDVAGTDAGDLSGHIVTNVTAELPGMPGSPKAVSIDDGRLFMSWGPPADNGGAGITGYEYRYAAGDTVPPDTDWIPTPGSPTVSGLRKGTQYAFEVRALNRAGAGLPVTFTTTTTGATDYPAVGVPVIAGTAEVRRTLTASTTGITDRNGLAGVGFGYQWVRWDGSADTDIPGARSLTYEVTLADIGKALKVRIGFADDAGNPESLTSEPTAPVPHADNAPPTSMDAVVNVAEDTTLTFAKSDFSFADADGHAFHGVKLISLATDGTLFLGGTAVAAAGREVPVASLDNGEFTFRPHPDGYRSPYATFTFKVSDGLADSDTVYTMTVNVTPFEELATGKPVITGTARVGRTLTASVSGIADPDGLANATFDYQWIQVNGGTESDISGATGNTYVLADADLNRKIKVRVTFSDDGGTEYDLTSDIFPSSGSVESEPVEVNALPTASNATVVTDEDTARAFAAVDFKFVDTDDDDTLSGVRLVTLPQAGALALGNSPVAADQVIAAADLAAGRFRFTPAENDSGTAYARFKFRVRDGAGESVPAYAMTIDVTAINDPPTAADATVSTREDRGLAFAVDQFKYADVEEGPIASVTIVTLPEAGELMLVDTPVVVGQAIGRAALASGHLRFTPAPDGHGMAYATFGFRVNDGTEDSVSTYTMTIHVTAANDLPTAMDSRVVVGEDTTYTFSATDFSFADIDGDPLSGVRITGLPRSGSGTLEVDDRAVTLNEVIGRAEIDEGKLRFTPAADGNGMAYTAFRFSVRDGSGDNPLRYTMFIDVTAANDAPTAANGSVSTAEDTAHVFGVGDFGFADPDAGDSLSSVKIVSLPAAGELVHDDTAVTENAVVPRASIDSGKFEYRPPPNVVGAPYASFGFKVSDGTAESAESYTVAITVLPSNDAPTAADSKIVTGEDTAHVFSAAEFKFADIDDGGSLSKVRIVDLPTAGALTLRNVVVGAIREVRKSAIDEGVLRYVPESNENGADYASFTFRVNDGTTESAADYRMTIDVTAANDAPTGAPEIVGTPHVDETLAATPGSIRDVDGLNGVTYAWQWIRSVGGVDADIVDATGRTYLVVAADVDNKLKVKATFTDNGGTTASLTSEPTPQVLDAPREDPNNPPYASGAYLATDEDTAYVFGATDFDFSDFDLDDTLVSVRIVTLPEKGLLTLDTTTVTSEQSTTTTGTVTSDESISRTDIDAGKLRFTPAANAHGFGYASFTFRVNDGVDESEYDATMSMDVNSVDDEPTGAPAITGTLRVDETLSADTSTIADADGLTNVYYDYQWVRVDGTNEVDIASAENSTYVLVAEDQGKKLKVKVVFYDDETNQATIESGPTAVVERSSTNNAPTAADIQDIFIVEDATYTFRVAEFNFSDVDAADSLSSVTVVSVPQKGTLLLGEDAVEDGASVPVADIVADRFKFAPSPNGNGYPYTDFTFKVNDGIDDSESSYTVTFWVIAQPDPATGEPVITGTLRVDQTLGVDTSGIADPDGLPDVVSYEYQWIRVDGVSETDIRHGYRSTYTLVAADVGKKLKIRVDFRDGTGSRHSRTSSESAEVAETAANTAPTAAPGKVATAEDTVYVFTAADFNFSDADDSDELVGVKIESLPAVGKLTLDAASVSISQVVPRVDIDGGKLRFAPVADASGDAYASFDFRVRDWADESESSYLMTIDVAAQDDDPTGLPVVVGTVRVGQTLTVDTGGIADADGLTSPDFSYQWIRVEGLIDTDIEGETGTGYTPVAEDLGNRLRVRVSFADDGGGTETLTSDTTAVVREDVPAVTVTYGASSYTASEDGAEAVVAVQLSAAPKRDVEIPLIATATGGATAQGESGEDYTGIPSSLTFGANETEKTFTITATDDSIDDDDEGVTLSFGAALPDGVTRGSPATATVSLLDNDAPSVTVAFDAASYEAVEGGTAVIVTVQLSAAPERDVEVPLTATATGGATAQGDTGEDYTGIPSSLTFAAAETEKTFTVTATDDSIDDDDEGVTLGFGAPLPDGVTPGSEATATVSLTDNDNPAVTVTYGASSYTASEDGAEAIVTVRLSAAPEREVVIPLTAAAAGGATAEGAPGADYAGIPASLTFAAQETEQTFTVTATDDGVDDDGESVTLGFGAPLPDGVTPGSEATATVSVTDNDNPAVTVTYGASSYTASEDGAKAIVTVSLSAAPERDVEVPLTATATGGATAQGESEEDYTGIPSSLTFGAAETEKTFTVTALDDSIDDDDEGVTLGFGAPLPDGVTPGSEATATVSLTDNDNPAVTVTFAQASYTASEGGTGALVTVRLSAAPEREVVIPLTAAAAGGATGQGEADADYAGVPANLTFGAAETEKTFTVTATDDSIDDDDEGVTLSFGAPLPDGVTLGSEATATVSLIDNDNPAVTVTYGASSYTASEDGAEAIMTVRLSAAPEREVVIPLTATATGGATAQGDSGEDYTGIPASLTFGANETEKTFTFTATDDGVDDDGESVTLGFGAPLPDGVTPGSEATATVSLTDNDNPAVTVTFAQASYTASEGGTGALVTVRLSAAPEREVVIPLTAAAAGGATGQGEADADYAGVPANLTFAAAETEKTFTVTATDDGLDDDGESVTLGFGAPLPDGVTLGSEATATVSLTDNDNPAVTVTYGASSYTASEDGAEAIVTVRLSAAPEREVVIPLTATATGGATVQDESGEDYTGIPSSLTFGANETEKTFTVTATDDGVDDDGEGVTLGFGAPLPDGVTPGSEATATLSLLDNDNPAVTVTFAQASYTASEDGAEAIVTVSLSAAPKREVVIPLTATATGGATAQDEADPDYAGIPSSLTFGANETEKTFTVTATDDSIDDDGEGVTLGFGAPLPDGVTLGSEATATVSLTDNDNPAVTVTFGASSYTASEDGAEAIMTVRLSAAPEREVVIPLTAAAAGGATAEGAPGADYAGIPASLTFAAQETEQTFTVTATDDGVDDDGESVTLGFGAPLPDGVTPGSEATATVSLTDNDNPAVTVTFGASSYTASEGGTGALVTVRLSAAPEREVVIPLTSAAAGGATGQGEADADYAGVPANLTFGAAETEKTFTVTALDDSIDDDDEGVTLSFGAPLPDGVTLGSEATATVSLIDADDPAVTVTFAQASYTASEDGAEAIVTVSLSAAPKREVVIPLTAMATGGATAHDEADPDYAGIPSSLTFGANETEKTFTVTATDDGVDDDGEGVTMGFGAPLPDGVTPGSEATATVSLLDNDNPAVTVTFAQASYTASEGGTGALVTVRLSAAPEREVVIPLTAAAAGGATVQDESGEDYTGIPSSLTFGANETEKTFTVTATDDGVDDDGEGVTLGFGAPLPEGVTRGSEATATVSLLDNDNPAVTVTFAQASYTASEGGAGALVTVRLSAAPEREVVIPLTAAAAGGATGQGEADADYADVPANLTFAAAETEKTFTITALDDSIDDDGEGVTLGFDVSLLEGVTPGSAATATVSLTDNDNPAVTVTYGASSYTASEDGAEAIVTVRLSAAPEREVVIPLTATATGGATAQGESGEDYTGIPSSLTFGAAETEKTFTVTATDDGVDDDGESVTLGFGAPLPDGVTPGSEATATVSLTDNDNPAVTVTYGASSYTASEDGAGAIVTVRLSAAPEREVVIPLTATTTGGATAQGDSGEDYTGIPSSLTFGANETEKTFTFTATDDGVDDDGESVTLGFGAPLPEGVTPGSEATATVSLLDNDNPAVTVTFAQASYTASEGGAGALVTVRLSAAPEREVVIPLTAAAAGGATGQGEADADYAGVPANLTFGAAETEKTFTVTALDDSIDDDDEGVTLSFGAPLPDGVTLGSETTATVSLIDNDVAGTLSLSISPIADDDVVNIAERRNGFPIAGATATVQGVAVTVTVGTGELDTTSGAGGAWSVSVPANASYVAGTDVRVTVRAAKEDYTDAPPLSHTLRVDLAAPTFGAATVDGASLAMNGSELLDTGSVPAASAFAVRVDGSPVALSNTTPVAVDATTVTLTLASGVTAAQTVTVQYTVPTGAQANPLRDVARNPLASDPSERTVSNVTPGAPDAPGSLTATPGNEQVTLRWQAPSGDGGAAITRYQYRAGENVDSTEDSEIEWNPDWTDVPDGEDEGSEFADETSYTVTSLTNDTAYRFEVRADNARGAGAAADIDATPVAVRTAPSRPPRPRNLRVLSGDGQVTLTWTAPPNVSYATISDYQYRYAADSSVPPDTDWNSAGMDMTETVIGLTNAVQYTFEVRSVAGELASSPVTERGTPSATVTEPGPPRFLEALERDGAVRLLWHEPERDGGSSIVRYEYRLAEGQSVPSDAPWHSSGDKLSVWVDGLTNGQPCTFEVRAVSRSPGATARTTATPVAEEVQEITGAPRNLTATAGSVRVRFGKVLAEVTLSWEPPASNGNGLLYYYEYRYAEGGSVPEDVRWNSAGRNDFSLTIRRLRPDATYTFEMRAVNQVGEGPAARTRVVTQASTAPELRLFASAAVAVEGEPFTFGVRRDSELDRETLAMARVTDSAVPDIAALRSSRIDGPGNRVVVLSEGDASGTATVTPPFDGERPASRTLTITLFIVNPPYAYGSPVTLTISVQDRDAVLSVAGATVREGPEAKLAFEVTLDRARRTAVSVDYATSDGSATAGEDYTAVYGALVFAPGETTKTVEVLVLDDEHDEDSETLTLTLFNPRGARLGEGTATGTIENSDPMPKAWVARFGRTVADQVLDAVDARLRAARAGGVSVSLAGQRVGGAAPKAEAKADERSSAASDGTAASLFGGTAAADAGETARLKALSEWLRQEAVADDRSRGWSRTLTGQQVLMGSSFSLAAETDGGGFAALWGRMAETRFAGREDRLNLDGDVTTGLLGADYGWGRWTTGLVVSHSIGEGGYRGESAGEIEATVTALTPWAGYKVTERLSVWGAAGYGAGELTLAPEGEPALKTDLGMMLAAAGTRGTLVGGEGPRLDAVTDAHWVRTTTARVSSASGNLASASASVTRLRLGLEGSWPLALGDGVLGKGATVTPRLAVGVRHDGGDAETGFGADIGGGVTLAAPAEGLTVSLDGRGVLTHEAAGVRDRGVAGTLAWNPPPTGRGPTLTLSQSFGAGASGGKDALLSRETLEGLAANDNGAGQRRLEARFGYGFAAFGGGFTMTPEIRLGRSDAGRDYSLGWRLTRAGSGPGSLELSIDATRRESANDDVPPEHGIGFRLTARF